MIVRVTTLELDRFREAGLDVGRHWTPIEIDGPDDERLAALETWVGRALQVYPPDLGNLAELGLELVEGRLERGAARAEREPRRSGETPATRTKAKPKS